MAIELRQVPVAASGTVGVMPPPASQQGPVEPDRGRPAGPDRHGTPASSRPVRPGRRTGLADFADLPWSVTHLVCWAPPAKCPGRRYFGDIAGTSRPGASARLRSLSSLRKGERRQWLERLVITVDQWRGRQPVLYGAPVVRTPHIDALPLGAYFSPTIGPTRPCGRAGVPLHRHVHAKPPVGHERHAPRCPVHQYRLGSQENGYSPVLFGYTDASADPATVPPATPAP